MPEGETTQRLRAAADAARALADEAGRLREGAPPPQGWAPADGGGAAPGSTPEVQAVAALLELARASLPPDLAARVLDVARELLLALRALIDLLLERIERRARDTREVAVEDIPID